MRHSNVTAACFLIQGTLETLTASAEAAQATYPQYRGFWAKAVVGTITRDIKGKGGIRFRKGDKVLLVAEKCAVVLGEGFAWTGYSERSGWNVALRARDVRVV